MKTHEVILDAIKAKMKDFIAAGDTPEAREKLDSEIHAIYSVHARDISPRDFALIVTGIIGFAAKG